MIKLFTSYLILILRIFKFNIMLINMSFNNMLKKLSLNIIIIQLILSQLNMRRILSFFISKIEFFRVRLTCQVF